MVKSKKKTTKPARESPKKQWCFTVNNPTINKEDLLEILKIHSHYVIIGDEIGEQGTPHFQGYIDLLKKQRMSTILALFKPLKPHLESRSANSTPYQAANYCKKDAKYVEFGISPKATEKKTTSTSLKRMCAALFEGQPIEEAMQIDPATYVRNYRGLQDYQLKTIKVPIMREMETHLYIGVTGSGKTHSCLTTYPECFKKPIGKSLWFDGYTNQKVVLIDEFTGQFPLSDMLQIMDKYPTQVERKGSHTTLQHNLLLLTTNVHPSNYYENWKGRKEQELAFYRRITKVFHFKARNDVEEITDRQAINDFLLNPPV